MGVTWCGGTKAVVCLGGLAMAVAAVAGERAEDPSREPLVLHARVRVQESGGYFVKNEVLRWDPARTAIIICDMWNQHWCQGATRRVGELAPAMNRTIAAARAKGVLIIHAPSSCMDAYKDHPARKRAQAAPKAANLPKHIAELVQQDPGRGEGDLPDRPVRRRLRRRAAVPAGIALEVPDRRHRDPRRGRHQRLGRRDLEPAREPRASPTSCSWAFIPICACSAGRSACGSSSSHGKNVVLVRDLTDTMYNSRMWPYVSHFEGTNRIVEHIEKYVAPTITSTDLTGQPAFRFQPDDRPRAVFLIGEDEYKTEKTLPAFAAKELEPLGIRCTLAIADPKSPHDFPGVEALDDADLLVLSVRRRAPTAEEMAIIRRYIEAGKPVVGIRTACHAFDTRGKAPAGHAEWTIVRSRRARRPLHRASWQRRSSRASTGARATRPHLILDGSRHRSPARARFTRSARWRARPMPLLMGKIPGQPPEPVAWVKHEGPRADFLHVAGPPRRFRERPRSAAAPNAILWALDRPAGDRRPRTEAAARQAAAAAARRLASLLIAARARVSPRAALASFKVPDDLQLDLVLAEPVVRQPVSITFDERGRLWVVQYLQYPVPAGLEDGQPRRRLACRLRQGPACPAPPFPRQGQDHDPRGYRRRRRLRPAQDVRRRPEHRDRRGARARRRLGAQPAVSALLSRPQSRRRARRRPRGPSSRVSAWRTRTRWSTACDGAPTAGSTPRRARRSPATSPGPGLDDGKEPVHSMGQLIWRYHPETRRYEVFAEGGGNAFGVEIDAKGRIYSGHNGGDTRGLPLRPGRLSTRRASTSTARCRTLTPSATSRR